MIRDLAELRVGDPVVHVEHGIGRYLGLQTMELGDGTTEFLREIGVPTIRREGTSADRQLAVHEASGGDMRAVVDHVAGETLLGVPAQS